MTKGMTFQLDEDLRYRLKIVAAFRKTTIKDVLINLVQSYVDETEAEMKPSLKLRKRSRKEAG